MQEEENSYINKRVNDTMLKEVEEIIESKPKTVLDMSKDYFKNNLIKPINR